MKDIVLFLIILYIINHVLEFIFSKERSLKWYSITKFKFIFFKSFFFWKGKKYIVV
jgi:hypothetical protein